MSGETKMRDKFKDLNMSEEEVRRFSEAMKKEEFRKLLLDYAEEISDPKNRELYEREISALEAERGMNVTFIHPQPGYCIATSQESSDGTIKKCFVNICKNEEIGKPTCKRESNGVSWSIPHSCSPPRDDFDSKNKENTCTVYDVVFSVDAFRMGQTNDRFDKLLIDSAFESIERNFHVKLDKVNSKRLKNIDFKGKPTACVLRKPSTENNTSTTTTNNSEDDLDPSVNSIIDQLKEQYLKNETVKSKAEPIKQQKIDQRKAQVKEETPGFTTPSYKLVHRGHVDMQDYANQLTNRVESTRPKELVVSVELPLCKSSENVVLDIFEKRLHLKSLSPNYLLDLALPFPINEAGARAKFDKSRRCLNVTLPVVPFVAKLDIVNVDHLSEDEDYNTKNDDQKSMSPSPSSSSSSSLTNESNLDAVIAAQQQQQLQHETDTKLIPKSSDNEIKRALPSHIKLDEYKNSMVIEMRVTNYKRRSVELKFVSESELQVRCESESKSGGYVQYFAAHLKFIHSVDFSESNFICSSLTNTVYSSDKEQLNDKFTVSFVDEEKFRIAIRKRDETNHGKKALLSTKPISLNSIDLNNNTNDYSTLDVSQQFIHMEFSEQLNFNKDTKNMSQRDFILNFEKIAIDVDRNSVQDEDDEDDDEEDNETAKKSKLAEKVSNRKREGEFMRKRTEQENREEDRKRAEEEDEETSLNSGNGNDSDHEPSESEDENNLAKSSENLGSSFSSSINDTSVLSSSLNSYSFYKLKSILKKPSRSVSESESSCTSPEIINQKGTNNNNSNFSTPANNRYSYSDGGSGSACFDRLSSSESSGSASGLKKCVSFNKQVVRNIFKPGSTISGMKKPGSAKNKKKKQQQRKRTISDPCSPESNSSAANNSTARARSVSESSSEDARFLLSPIAAKQQSNKQTQAETNSKKSSKKKKKNNQSNNNNDSPVNKEPASTSTNSKADTQRAIQFKNKFVLSLDE